MVTGGAQFAQAGEPERPLREPLAVLHLPRRQWHRIAVSGVPAGAEGWAQPRDLLHGDEGGFAGNTHLEGWRLEEGGEARGDSVTHVLGVDNRRVSP